MNIVDNGRNNFIDIPSQQEGNLLIEGDNNTIKFSKFSFSAKKLDIHILGDNCELNIDRLRRVGVLRLILKNGGKLFIGEKTTFESTYILCNQKEIKIGKDCMISFETTIRSTDSHGIYDIKTGKRLNQDGDVYIGDHVWLGQGVIISKKVQIGNNVVVGARTFIGNKKIDSNLIVAGNPLKIIKKNIVWDRRMCDDLYADNADYDPFLKDTFKF